MKNIWKEFKEFAVKGNVIDLAIGIIIGAAFGGVVNSLVNDVLMPPLGMLIGKVDFSNLFITISGPHFNTLAESKAHGAVTLNYGLFINTIINFLIVAFAVFLLVKQVNIIKRRLEAEPPTTLTTKVCDYCQSVVNIKATRCPYCTSELETI